jgi:hypothetical protein
MPRSQHSSMSSVEIDAAPPLTMISLMRKSGSSIWSAFVRPVARSFSLGRRRDRAGGSGATISPAVTYRRTPRERARG